MSGTHDGESSYFGWLFGYSSNSSKKQANVKSCVKSKKTLTPKTMPVAQTPQPCTSTTIQESVEGANDQTTSSSEESTPDAISEDGNVLTAATTDPVSNDNIDIVVQAPLADRNGRPTDGSENACDFVYPELESRPFDGTELREAWKKDDVECSSIDAVDVEPSTTSVLVLKLPCDEPTNSVIADTSVSLESSAIAEENNTLPPPVPIPRITMPPKLVSVRRNGNIRVTCSSNITPWPV